MHLLHADGWDPFSEKITNSQISEILVSSENPAEQRKVFRYLRSADTKTRNIYFQSAVQMVTSKKLNLATKKKVLKSLADFMSFSDEGIFESVLDIRDSAYYDTLDSLADFLENENDSKEEFREVFLCLTEMDYFRVKNTLMMGFVEYIYPHDAGWYAKRLRLCAASLEKGDDLVAWHVISFLGPLNGYRELQSLLTDTDTEKNEKALLEELLNKLDALVPHWLLSSDYKVAVFACLYCNARELEDTLPLLEQINFPENELVRDVVEATIKKLSLK
jgi:hypothetical protein